MEKFYLAEVDCSALEIGSVSLGTVGTIVTVQGRAVVAFFLAVIEISIWITAISTIISQIDQSPILVMFYSLGYACGTVTGILVGRKLAFGRIILKVFAASNGHALADKIRSMGQPVIFFITGWVRSDLVAMLVILVFMVSGVLSIEQSLAGFSDPVVIFIVAMFIVSEAIVHTGITQRLGNFS